MIQIYPTPWCYKHGAFHHDDDCPKHRRREVIAKTFGILSLLLVMALLGCSLCLLSQGWGVHR